jgi:gliding motility-associated-like protein
MSKFRDIPFVESKICRYQLLKFDIRHSIFDIRHSIFDIRYSILILSSLLLPFVLFAQLSAGPDVTINPGVPVTLTAKYGKIGTGVAIAEDGVSTAFDILFPFSFFGKTYTQFYIGANGWISFSPNQQAVGVDYSFSIPNPTDQSIPRNCILGPFVALSPQGSGSPYIYFDTVGKSPARKLIVMWCQCPMYPCSDSTVTFQIILNETSNIIETQISHKPKCLTLTYDGFATLGVLDGNVFNSKGFPVTGKNNSLWEANKEAWRFEPNITQDIYTPNPMQYQMVPITPGDKIEYRWYEGSNPDPFSWDSTVVVTPNETTTYYVTATICSGETFTSTVTVTVVPKIPDAFTPNEDGLNDTFEILGLPAGSITKYNIKIYNRWGQMVFTSNDITVSWNGKMNNTGEICPEGDYAWVIYYEKVNKNKVTNKGSVILLR